MKNYDYSQTGAYFLTIRTYRKICLFDYIVNGEMRLSAYGRIVENEWRKTAKLRLNVMLDEFIIMPNHVHGILHLIDNNAGTARRAPTIDPGDYVPEKFGKPTSGSLSSVIRSFKSAVTKHINEMRKTPGDPIWQRNYHEHVIRNDYDLNDIRDYIMNNPLRWRLDKENPKKPKMNL